jgi:hypothetical protein
MPKAQAAVEEPSAAPLDVIKLDKELKDTIEAGPAADAPATNGTSVAAADAAATTKAEELPLTPDVAEKAVQEESQVETPAEPAPTPSATQSVSNSKPAASTQPAAPAKPLTWASRAAAAAGPPKPAVPAVAPKTSTPPAQARAPPAVQPAKPAPAAPAAPAPSAAEKDKENTNPSGGWQNVGSDHAKRQNRPQSISAPPEKEGTMGYVRNVTEKVPAEDLRAALSSFGQLIYFDINRSKVSAHP